MQFKLFLHNASHLFLPFLLSTVLVLSGANPKLCYLASFLGAFLPDIDHLKIYLDYRFKSFWHFVKYCATSDRYRKSFLLFHNFPAIIVISFLLPFAFWVNRYFGIFVLSFFSHLVLDLLFDVYATRRFSSWKLTRRI